MTLHKTLRPRLFLRCALLLLVVFGLRPASAQCKAGDPNGKFSGTATSGQSGELALTLHLLCDKGSYAGSLDTPVGVYTVVSGTFTDGTLTLDIASAGNHIKVALKRAGDDLTGTFSSSDDSGPVTLHRVAEAVAPAARTS